MLRPDFPQQEEKILKFWQENKIFEKLREKIKGRKPWSFLDGPITANNPMGVHHAWGRTYKDLFQRYKAMRGFDQRFQNGFDCQGLWVEVEVEKDLGFKNKKDIEKFGIEKFVKNCKKRVLKYAKVQTEESIRLGQWMDWKNSYYTMSDENNYAIWYFLKKCWKEGLLYKGLDVVPWCPRCGTAISQHEILTEEYKELVHKSIYVKFQITNNKSQTNSKSQITNRKFYFLVWTTTPWTLPANVALAVHPDLLYVKVRDKEGNNFILLKARAGLIKDSEIVEEFKGKELEGLEYQGLFDELPAVKEAMKGKKHKVVLWKGVSPEEGTGIVHTAPGCGQEDFQLSKDYRLPVVDPADGESRYKKGFGFLEGKLVTEAADLIFENLKEKGRVFKIENYRHRYPTCWRCKTELIFRLVPEWYISMEKLRTPLMELVRKINWIPSFGLDRELDWLKNMQDWLISKKRYWGLALPIYECKECGSFEVIGSKQELKKRAVEGWEEFQGHSPHRPWIDKVKIKCSKCGASVSRVLDVGTPWLDAGIVPFSTMGYFSDRDYWQKWFPADLICESFPGQFKNWFYSLIVMSQVLKNTEPVKTIFGYALVRDEKGEEMHKSKGNVIWFSEAVEKIGADIMRWMYARQNIVYNLRFGYQAAKEIKRKILTLWNSFAFFETYVSKKEFPHFPISSFPKSQNLLDQWIVSCLNNLIERVTKALDGYNVAGAVLSIEKFFIDDLSLWYIRRSRKRLQKPASDKEKAEAAATLYYVLLNLMKLIAPIMPFLAETIYLKLRQKNMPVSVHLFDWPLADKEKINPDLEEKMRRVREIVGRALALRAEKGIRVRQPLGELRIKSYELRGEEELLDLIKQEVNVKEIVFDGKIKKELRLDTKLTPKLRKEGFAREIVRTAQNLRKKAGLVPKEKINLFVLDKKTTAEVLKVWQKDILVQTNSQKLKLISEKEISQLKYYQRLKLDKTSIAVGISKAK